MKKGKTNKINVNKLFKLVAFFLLLGIFVRGAYLALSPEIEGINLKSFASKRTTKKDVLTANRGTIYDINGKVLAQNVSSYTLIAYLSSTRTENIARPRHVLDIDLTAEKLAPILKLEKEKVVEYLTKTNVYQTEFGNTGRGLTEITKDEILALGLPGLDFIETKKRYYPNGDFLSYTLGYAKSEANGLIVGEMGIEKQYNDILMGKDGYVIYQKDLRGYKITNTKEIVEEAEQGKDIYLTINNNIQFFVDQAISNSLSKYQFEAMDIIVASAKTGAILGMANYPSFNPNTRNITNYLDPNVTRTYEPGSTMKIYSYMATMEAGKYQGDATFKSGTYVTKDKTEIGDHDRAGWGTITFDRGFTLSSNVGSLHLVKDYINADILKSFYQKIGFGSKTGIELPNEKEGKLNFKYETEIFNATFGQGITTTAMQNVKALMAIANNGVVMQPYLVDKIVEPETGKIILQNEKKELERVASAETVGKIKSLMKSVIEEGTGSTFKLDGYDIIAKTGTAQIPTTDGTGYISGKNNVIRGFAGIYPANDPELIIYATVTKSSLVNPLSSAVKEIIVNATKYLNLNLGEEVATEKLVSYQMESFINKTTEEVTDKLATYNITPTIIGDGKKIINQYPAKGNTIDNHDRVILITTGDNYLMPNIINWSKKDVQSLSGILKFKVNYTGQGYVIKQSIAEKTKLDQNSILDVKLDYKFSVKNE